MDTSLFGRIVLFIAFLAGPAGCRQQSTASNSGPDISGGGIQLTSTAFAEGQAIPEKYTGTGTNVSPPLAWSGVPEATKELVLICDDPDAPQEDPWVHWVLYKIPPTVTGLPEGMGGDALRGDELSGIIVGRNSFDRMGYGGPMPPVGHGMHRYFFRLYALDTELKAEPGLRKSQVFERIQGHVIDGGRLMGTFER